MTTTFKIQETGVEICFVPLPEDATKLEFGFEPDTLEFISNGDYVFIDIPQGDWSFLSTYSELTEEKLEGVMPQMPWGNNCYKNYCLPDGITVQMVGKTALECFNSLMTKLECYTDNPYGEKEPSMSDYDISGASQDYMDGLEMKISMNREQWQEAQQRTHADFAILIRKF